jgi:hypothetical protein
MGRGVLSPRNEAKRLQDSGKNVEVNRMLSSRVDPQGQGE